MNNEFCQVLAANDRPALERIVNNFLNELSVTDDAQQNFKKIENWIASHDCVSSVEVPSYLIDTDPPIKQFIVSIHGTAEPITIGIMLHNARWRFHKK